MEGLKVELVTKKKVNVKFCFTPPMIYENIKQIQIMAFIMKAMFFKNYKNLGPLNHSICEDYNQLIFKNVLQKHQDFLTRLQLKHFKGHFLQLLKITWS